jgi:hypothetical protein
MPEFFALFTRAFLRHHQTYTTPGEVVAAALWAPPGAVPVSGEDADERGCTSATASRPRSPSPLPGGRPCGRCGAGQPRIDSNTGSGEASAPGRWPGGCSRAPRPHGAAPRSEGRIALAAGPEAGPAARSGAHASGNQAQHLQGHALATGRSSSWPSLGLSDGSCGVPRRDLAGWHFWAARLSGRWRVGVRFLLGAEGE